MSNENKKLSAAEIIKQAQKVQLNMYEQKTLTDAEFWPKREQQLIDAIVGLRDQTASLEAEVKRLHQELDLRCAHVIAKDELLSRLTNKHEAEVKGLEFEAMERRADLQDLENENDDLLSKTERLDVEVKRLESEPIKDIGHSEAIYEKMYEALKERVDALQGSLIKSTQETEDLKQKADGLCEALKTIVNGDIGPIGLHKAQQAITNYENQE